ncbi:MAG: amino acid adenylation domain-containing protein [Caldilineaceae bacterium]|nr:amino acid adenylation domain-containing protein [Caldilineaceae bacterium]
MSVAKLVIDFIQRGVQLGIDGDQLTVRAPANLLTAQERAALGSHKAEILALLRDYASGSLALYPLSHGQRALWFVHQLAPESAAYHIMLALQIDGTLDQPVLGLALQALIERHEVLRTTYPAINDQPVQMVTPAQAVSLPLTEVIDCSQDELQARLMQEADRPIDLVHGPILRTHLFKRSATEHILLLTLHHIAIDFWSLETLIDELSHLYGAYSKGEKPTLPAIQRQFSDYVRWQNEMLSGERGEQLRTYWREKLGGELPVLNLATDRPRPHVQTYRGASTPGTTLPAQLARGIRQLAQAEATTAYTVILAALQVLLHRYSGQADLLIGSPMSGRSRPEFKDIAGYCVNPTVIRADLSGDPTIRTYLQRIRPAVIGAIEHVDYPFPLLVEQLQPVRDLSRSPLFQVGFAWDKSQIKPASGPDGSTPASQESIGWKIKKLEQRGAQFDLVLTVYEYEQSLSISWRYNVDLFGAATIARMEGHFVTLLTGLVTNPTQHLSELPLLTESERKQLLVDWNETKAEFPADHCFHQLFEAQVERTPEAIALIFQDQQLSYRELDRRANQLARHLQGLGVAPGTLVGVCVERSPEMIVGILGTLKAGGAYVPIDPAYPQDRVAFMLADAQIPILLSQTTVLPKLPDHQAQVISLDDDWPLIAQQSDVTPDSAVTANDPAYVIYTSGSTGQPKGAMIGHRGLCNMSEAQVRLFQLGLGDRMLQFSSLSFDASTFEICMALRVGATLCMGTRESLMPGPPLLKFMQDHAITICTLTPSTLAALPSAELPALHTITVAGEACSAELVAQWHKGRRFFNLYGPTEATIWATYAVCDSQTGKPSIGRPIQNTQTYVLDENLQPVPAGVPGELHIGGVGLSLGYINRPELTAAKFIHNPFSELWGARLYKTGDLVRYLPDGNIEFLGRIDHQVKLRGFRIELGEIENVLNAHPAIQETLVLMREETPGDPRLVAYIVSHQANDPATAPSVRELRAFLQDKLPEYMVPAHFVLLAAFPQTPNGKIDRKALPSPMELLGRGVEHVAPRGKVEETIASVWQEVLAVERVGLYDNFFDLGGHSLLIIQVHGKLQQQLGREIQLTDLFQFPTVASLSAHLAHRQNGYGTPKGAQAAQLPADNREGTDRAVAIVGLAGRFPKSKTLDAFWQNLCDGLELIAFLSDDELAAAGVDAALLADPHYVKANSFLEDADLFDADFFGFNPREAALLDPQHRLFLECAHAALENAGYDPDRYPGAIGLFAGSSASSYYAANVAALLEQMDGAGQYQAALANDKDFLTTRVSYKLNLRGPSVAVQTACSTSLVAVQMACQALFAGQCDLALAGGVSITFPQKVGYRYQEGMILSPDGHCRAFDAQAQGTIAGQGVGLVVLKPLSEALAGGDTIYAVIRGAAVNNDGAVKVGYTAPSVEGQAQVIALAQAAAGIDPATISYVEAHGTGTPLGDPTEIAALSQVFRAHTDRQGFCAIGSVKSNLGHLDAAAGVAGLLKTTLALQHQLLPPSLHYSEPNPQIDFAHSPFYVNNQLTPWEGEDGPRRAAVSSFGIGGTNAHVVLEEAPAQESQPSQRPVHLLLLAAKSATALAQMAHNLHEHLAQTPAVNLADVAHTLQVGRGHYRHRRAIVCHTSDEAMAALADATQHLSGVQEAKQQPVVFLFPGQGAQFVNMGRALYQHEAVFAATVDRCAEALLPLLGLDLRGVLYPPEGTAQEAEATAREQLRQTAMTQPALFVIEYALAQLWQSWGVQPQAMLGHSIGEYVAACLAGVMTLDDALKLVAVRGRLMQQLPTGAMLAVPLSEEKVRLYLSGSLSLAVINGPERCVISGPAAEIESLEASLAREGVAAQRLETSHAFHSAMLEPVLAEFAAAVRQVTLHAPRLPYLSNVTGQWIRAEEATDADYWARQMRQTVRFSEGLSVLLEEPGWVLLEVGPGQTLSTLARRHPDHKSQQTILASLPKLPGPKLADDDGEMQGIMQTLGRLWLAGVEVAWEQLYQGEARRRIPLPTYPFERQRHWIEPQKRTTHQGRSPAQMLTKRPDLADWFYLPSWTRQEVHDPGDAGSRLGKMRQWLLFVDDCGLGAKLIERLVAAGERVTIVQGGESYKQIAPDLYSIQPNNPDDYDALFTKLTTEEKLPDEVVHFWNVTATSTTPVLERLEDTKHRSFYSLLYLAQSLGRHNVTKPVQIQILSNEMQMVTGEERLRPEKATVLGACRVFPLEYPNVTVRSIDVVWPESRRTDGELIDQLLAELVAGASDAIVAYRGRYRWVQSFEPLRLVEPTKPNTMLREQGVYLITGGLGGIGLTLAEFLAEQVQAKLVITGRSSLPERTEWPQWLTSHSEQDPVSRKIHKIQSLEKRGAEVMVLSADVADLEQMQDVIRQTEARFGRINGLIHAAGVPSGGVIQLKKREAVEATFAPKLRGSLVLERVLEGIELDFWLICSSLASVLGVVGQVDYAGANAFLDAFAHAYTMKHDTPCIAVNWDTWQEVGMAAGSASDNLLLRQRQQEYLRYGLLPEEGKKVFDRILTRRSSQILVSTRDLRARVDQEIPALSQQATPAEKTTVETLQERPERFSDFVAPRTELEGKIVSVWQELLGMSQIGVFDNFFDLGGDSLLGIQVAARLNEALATELTVQDLFDAPQIAGLAEIITATLLAAQTLQMAQNNVTVAREEIEL